MLFRSTVTNPPDSTCNAPRFCSVGSPVCLYPPVTTVSEGSLSGHLLLKPNLVPKNGSTTVAWNLTNVVNCTVTSTNADSWSGASSTVANTVPGNISCTHVSTGACVSNVLTSQTVFTLSCTQIDPGAPPYVEQQTVNIIPGFEETCATGYVHSNGKCVVKP